MKVTTSAWSERINGCTHFCVAVKNDQHKLYEIFVGKARSNDVAYKRAFDQAKKYIDDLGYELEA